MPIQEEAQNSSVYVYDLVIGKHATDIMTNWQSVVIFLFIYFLGKWHNKICVVLDSFLYSLCV